MIEMKIRKNNKVVKCEEIACDGGLQTKKKFFWMNSWKGPVHVQRRRRTPFGQMELVITV